MSKELHNKILSLPCNPRRGNHPSVIAYKAGHRDALNAAAELVSAPSAAPQLELHSLNAVVYPPDGTVSPFTVINLGHGLVKMGDSLHDGRLPALWFGKDGLGIGVAEEMNRAAKEGETLAVVTFSNVDGLDVLAEVVQRIRSVSFPDAPMLSAAAPQVVADERALPEPVTYMLRHPGCVTGLTESGYNVAMHKLLNMPAGSALVNLYTEDQMRVALQAAPVPHIPANFTTHRSAWRDAINECINVEKAAGNADQAAYWQHELYLLRRQVYEVAKRLVDEELDAGDVVNFGKNLCKLSQVCTGCHGEGDDGDAPDANGEGGWIGRCGECGGTGINRAAPAAQGDTITLTRDELVDNRNQAFEQGVCEGKDQAAQGDGKDAERYRTLRELAYRFGVGNPSPEQLDKDLDAAIAAKAAS